MIGMLGLTGVEAGSFYNAASHRLTKASSCPPSNDNRKGFPSIGNLPFK